MDELEADGSILRHDSVMTQPNLITLARIEARGLPSGVYFYRLEAEAFRVVRQMLLLQ